MQRVENQSINNLNLITMTTKISESKKTTEKKTTANVVKSVDQTSVLMAMFLSIAKTMYPDVVTMYKTLSVQTAFNAVIETAYKRFIPLYYFELSVECMAILMKDIATFCHAENNPDVLLFYKTFRTRYIDNVCEYNRTLSNIYSFLYNDNFIADVTSGKNVKHSSKRHYMFFATLWLSMFYARCIDAMNEENSVNN